MVERYKDLGPKKFGHWFMQGESGGDDRTRFLILKRQSIYIAVDIWKCGFPRMMEPIRPQEWRLYSNLDVAIAATLIRGA